MCNACGHQVCLCTGLSCSVLWLYVLYSWWKLKYLLLTTLLGFSFVCHSGVCYTPAEYWLVLIPDPAFGFSLNLFEYLLLTIGWFDFLPTVLRLVVLLLYLVLSYSCPAFALHWVLLSTYFSTLSDPALFLTTISSPTCSTSWGLLCRCNLGTPSCKSRISVLGFKVNMHHSITWHCTILWSCSSHFWLCWSKG